MSNKKKIHYRYLKGEKFMYFLVVLLIIAIPTVNIFTKALLSKTIIETENIQDKINKQENINEGLSMQKDELVSMENIQKVASEYGLSYRSDNIVKVTYDEEINSEN